MGGEILNYQYKNYALIPVYGLISLYNANGCCEYTRNTTHCHQYMIKNKSLRKSCRLFGMIAQVCKKVIGSGV